MLRAVRWLSGLLIMILLGVPVVPVQALSRPADAFSDTFTNTVADTVAISGLVTDGSGHSYPLYARIDVIGGANPQTVFTDPFTGTYTLNVQRGIQITLTVTAVIAGYEVDSEILIPLEDMLLNFQLVAAAECTAPGYYNVLFEETFDSVAADDLPADWETEILGPTKLWRTANATNDPPGWPPVTEPNLVYISTSTINPGITVRLYREVGLDLSAVSGAVVVFQMFHDNLYPNTDKLQPQLSLDGGVSWLNIGAPIDRYAATTGWQTHQVDISAYTGEGFTDVRMGFNAISGLRNDIHLDNVAVHSAECSLVPGGVIAGYVTASGTPLDGASVTSPESGSVSVSEPGDPVNAGLYWFFQPTTGSPQTVHVTAQLEPQYIPEEADVSLGQDALQRQDFDLTHRSAITINGAVTDGGGHGYPLYASVHATGPGFETMVYTDPFTGAYTLTAYAGVTYHLEAWAKLPGYNMVAVDLTPAGNETRNFSLTIAGDCITPGYEPVSTVVYTEDFETVTPPALPAGWDQENYIGDTGEWATSALTVHPVNYQPYSGDRLAYFNSWNATGSHATRLYRTSGSNLSAMTAAVLRFWMFHDTFYDESNDRLQIQVSVDAGNSWTNAGPLFWRYDGSTGWKQHTVDLTAFVGQTDVRVALLAYSDNGNDIHIDKITIERVDCTLDPGGLVAGYVVDANTAERIAGARIAGGGGSAASLDLSPDLAHTGLYMLFQSTTIQPQSVDYDVTYPRYDPTGATVSVYRNQVNRQDYTLSAGQLTFTPEGGLQVNLPINSTLSSSALLGNTGTQAVSFTLREVAGPQTSPISSAYGVNTISDAMVTFVLDNPGVVSSPGPVSPSTIKGGDFRLNDFSRIFALDFQNEPPELITLATANASKTIIGSADPGEGYEWTGLAIAADGILYASASNGSVSQLYTLDDLTGEAELVGVITNSVDIRGLAVDGFGRFYGVDIYQDSLLQINPLTGVGRVLGSLNVNLNFDQSLEFDETSGRLYLSTRTPARSELRTVNLTTGATSLVAPYPSGYQIDGLAIASGSDNPLPWLTADLTTGSLAPGAAQAINLNFDATNLTLTPPGDYSGWITSWDDSPYGVTVLPVQMHVQGYGVELTPPAPDGANVAGSTVSYNLTLTNSGELSTSYHVAVVRAGGETWTFNFNPAATPVLQPGETATVTVNVTIPAGATSGQNTVLTVTVTADADPMPNRASDVSTLTTTVNAPPLPINDNYTLDEDAVLVVDAAGGVLSNDTDPESDPLEAVLVNGPTSGVVYLAADGSFIYTPNTDENGSDSFTYAAQDGYSAPTATVLITVNPVNDPPELMTPIPDQQTISGLGYNYIIPVDAFIDRDGDVLSYTAGLENGDPLPGWLSFDPTTRRFSGLAPDLAVTYSIVITASDPGGLTVSDIYQLEIRYLPEHVFLPAVLR
ncbi:MAG TPA: Ig-like domain-containing protein [Anaerolineaceae bacterium]|nr:Ig-like domain-containing protein [Anaerolineaceae bacterium]